MGVQERRAREKEELRELILETARRLFVNEGYEAVSMRRIAEQIEYSPTAIYLHFADKAALFRTLCDEDFLALAREFQVIATIADPVERFRALGLAYIEFGLAHPNHYRLMFMTPEAPEPSAEQLARRGRPEEDAYAFLKHVLQGIQDAGRLHPDHQDIDGAAQVAWAMVHGIVALHIAHCDDAWVDWRPVHESARRLVDTVVRGMTVDAPASARGAGR